MFAVASWSGITECSCYLQAVLSAQASLRDDDGNVYADTTSQVTPPAYYPHTSYTVPANNSNVCHVCICVCGCV